MQLKIGRGNSQYVTHFRIVGMKGRFSSLLHHFYQYEQLSGTDLYKTANCVDACNFD